MPTPTATASPASPAQAQPVSVEMLVALATSEPPHERRRRQIAAADSALGALERLNAGLVPGLPNVERLREVAASFTAEETTFDPALAVLLKEIELRVRVELAKHDIVA